jgi:hypothetical protein
LIAIDGQLYQRCCIHEEEICLTKMITYQKNKRKQKKKTTKKQSKTKKCKNKTKTKEIYNLTKKKPQKTKQNQVIYFKKLACAR